MYTAKSTGHGQIQVQMNSKALYEIADKYQLNPTNTTCPMRSWMYSTSLFKYLLYNSEHPHSEQKCPLKDKYSMNTSTHHSCNWRRVVKKTQEPTTSYMYTTYSSVQLFYRSSYSACFTLSVWYPMNISTHWLKKIQIPVQVLYLYYWVYNTFLWSMTMKYVRLA